ncbi:helicase-associated domain-containing protein, partial [Salinispira pacifica]
MVVDTRKPLIVQGDSTVLLDVHDEGYETARAEIAPFAELEKSPEHMHTYRITPLSLWNAASTGLSAAEITGTLRTFSRYPVPENVAFFIEETISRYGKLRLTELPGEDSMLLLTVDEAPLRAELEANRRIAKYLLPHPDGFQVRLFDRGTIKQELIRIGYPVQDEAPLADGEHLEFGFRDSTLSGGAFSVRDYQREAASAFIGSGRPGTGFGTIVLPCGAGKTIVGMAVMEKLATNVLILTTNVAAVHQWIDELQDKTDLPPEMIGEYTG